MPGRLTGKTAMVIGAGSIGPGWGNGKASAVLFAREGANVVCVDRSDKAAAETVEIIRGEGGIAQPVTADASNSAQVKAAVELAMERFGRIDVLQNNVGITEIGGVVELPEETWDHVFDVNLKSMFLSMKHVIPIMVEQGGGSIINISSISSIRYLDTPYVSYYTTKAAVNHMTRVTAGEYASRQVRVNAVLPGFMDTPMAVDSAKRFRGLTEENKDAAWRAKAARVPMGWMGDGWDIANAALFFASDESRFVTGAQLVVDGGTTLRS
jgi:NAD(P)-dependent dehydrogenase (short-subunit alcohol dehydrogenase family)